MRKQDRVCILDGAGCVGWVVTEGVGCCLSEESTGLLQGLKHT